MSTESRAFAARVISSSESPSFWMWARPRLLAFPRFLSRVFPNGRFVIVCRVEVRTSLRRPHLTHELVSIPAESVENSILFIRGQKVILDRALAKLYGVSAKALNQAVKRNPDRFPPDFMFQLTMDEARALGLSRSRSQIVTLNKARGGNIKYRPYAFTEHGILMLSSVLKSERAVLVNIEIMRAFVRLREMLASNAELNQRLDALEGKYDGKFRLVFEAIRELIDAKPTKRKPIGFRASALKK